jgi:hypothetical protein
MSKFSLLCQAARVLGKVISFLNRSGPRNGTSNSSSNEDVNARQDDIERIQLDTTLQAMITAAMQLDEPDLDTITFIYGCAHTVPFCSLSHFESHPMIPTFTVLSYLLPN